MQNYILVHNNRNLQEQQAQVLPCNCRKFVCPAPGKCRLSGVVYQAAVTIDKSAMNEGKTEADNIFICYVQGVQRE